jgi:methionyl-tRNA formyltransferase
MKKESKNIFFGTPEISVYFLEKLKELGFLFDLIITNPDKPVGRKQILTPPPVKKWAEKNNIDFLQPEKIDNDFFKELERRGFAAPQKNNFFFVLAYNKILPKKLLEIPSLGVVNLHPSLLPKYRGPSPIISAILDDQKETGFSLMLLDEKMDHGPILAQEKIKIDE